VLHKSAWKFGPVHTLVQATPTAELYALVLYLRHDVPFEGMYVFHIYCSHVVDSCNQKAKAQIN